MLISFRIAMLFIMLMFIFSNYISILLGISSTAPGLIVFSLLSIILYAGLFSINRKIVIPISYLERCRVVVFLVLFMYICTISINSYDFMHVRFLTSYFLLIGIIFVATLVNEIVCRCKAVDFDYAVSLIFWILLFIGILSTYLMINHITPRKSMILFTEPSHYAIYFSPLLLYKSYINFSKRKISVFIYLSLTFILVLLIENITLLAGLLITFGTLYVSNLRILLPIIIAMILFVMNSDYFLTRLTLSTEINNLSVLVYLSGWERAYLALIDSHGFGLGFQQMGIGPKGIFMENLSQVDANGLNYNDGGTIGSKLVSEFGLLGIALLVMYIRVGVKVLQNMVKNKDLLDPKIIFFNSIYLMMFIPIFIRGSGYYGSISLMFLVSLIWINKANKFYSKRC